ncbi:hypothetical protein BW731_02000 [Vagococcus martis]|uniref:Helix-hairpin-helix DNA-binding motif class 1 domain-containing protein n=1 Tax=Vagococcus martis TaxID=1768210 RepID=A0A1V4DEZ4_9ENTE|nr:helix-hairpin-helix domain-containing protein [Vagococcus martis]OPF87062.1 hypothetical protein BW731_02000 [Vagococcus martis]
MDIVEKLKEKGYIVIGGIFGLIVFIMLLYNVFKPKPDLVMETTQSSTTYSTVTSSEEMSDEMYVDIKGAVVKPGIYKVNATMRVLTVVEMAGGFLPEADDRQVNLSERVSDQMVIYIPKEGEELAEVTPSKNASSKDETTNTLVNLNTATIEELKTLNGVGEKKAENILRYREEKGSFKSIEELKEVDGIGEKTFEQLKSSITV